MIESRIDKISNKKDLLTDRTVKILNKKLQACLEQQFGYYALLYSDWADKIVGDHLSIKNKIVIDDSGRDMMVKCHFNALPFASDSIDFALLPNILNYEQEPQHTLRELERVLMPEGMVVVIQPGIMNWKSWKQKLSFLSVDSNETCKQGRFTNQWVSRIRLNDWFKLLGFQLEECFGINPTCEKIQGKEMWPWFSAATKLYGNYLSSYYIIVARKKVSTLTPIRTSWRKNKHLVPPRFAEPSVRHIVDRMLEQIR